MRMLVAAGAAISIRETGGEERGKTSDFQRRVWLPRIGNLSPRKPSVKNGLALVARVRSATFCARLRSSATPITYRTWSATERHQRTQPFSDRPADAGHITKSVQIAEGARRISVRDDAFGQHWTDSGQRFDDISARAIQIDHQGRPGVSERRRDALRFSRSHRIDALQLSVERR